MRCENVVLDGIRILNGGHFAIIAEGTRNMTVNDLIVDTNRDAYNIDCTQTLPSATATSTPSRTTPSS